MPVIAHPSQSDVDLEYEPDALLGADRDAHLLDEPRTQDHAWEMIGGAQDTTTATGFDQDPGYQPNLDHGDEQSGHGDPAGREMGVSPDAWAAPKIFAPGLKTQAPIRRPDPLTKAEQEESSAVRRAARRRWDRRPSARRAQVLRHRRFAFSPLVLVSGIIAIQAIGVLVLKKQDSDLTRRADALDREIKSVERETREAVARLSASVSPALLNEWAQRYEFRRATMLDMDDVPAGAFQLLRGAPSSTAVSASALGQRAPSEGTR